MMLSEARTRTKTLYLCGAGNSEGVRLALKIRQARRPWKEIVLLDDDPNKLGESLLGVDIVGPISDLEAAESGESEVSNLVARTTTGRAAVASRILSSGVPAAKLVHPRVDILGASYDSGVVVYENAILGPETFLGPDSVVFMGAVVGHEARVGRGCVIASGAVLNARVELEDEVYVGTNASILPEIKIGRGATIGANTAVIEDVPAGATVVGVPGQILSIGGTDSTHPAEDSSTTAIATDRLHVSELEKMIATVFGDVLEIESVSLTTSFFESGGTSLLALKTVERIRHVARVDTSPIDLFRFPTIRSLALHLGGGTQVPASSTTTTNRKNHVGSARAEARRRRRRRP